MKKLLTLIALTAFFSSSMLVQESMSQKKPGSSAKLNYRLKPAIPVTALTRAKIKIEKRKEEKKDGLGKECKDSNCP